MPQQSETLILILSQPVLAENQQILILVWPDWGLNPRSTALKHANQYTNHRPVYPNWH